MKKLIILLTLFAFNSNASDMPCPAGYQGNLLDKFVGEFSSTNGEFKYKAQRRSPARTIVKGTLTFDTKDYEFNILISPYSTLRLELLAVNHGEPNRVYSGSICGIKDSEGDIQLSLVATDNETLGRSENNEITFIFNNDLLRPTSIWVSKFKMDYDIGVAGTSPLTIYKLK